MGMRFPGVALWAAALLAAAPVAAQVSLEDLEQGEARAQEPEPGVLAEEEIASGVTLRVVELERLGTRAVKATLEVENASGDDVSLKDIGVIQKAGMGVNAGYDMAHYSLVDFENGKKYKVIKDTQGTCLCSRGSRIGFWQLEAGQSRKLWVQLTPPPLEVTTVSLEIPGAMMFDELPIAP